MYENNDFIGVDISKDTFDVWNPVFGHHCLENNKSGFRDFLKILGKHPWCVMESTGSYHYQLALFLLFPVQSKIPKILCFYSL